MIDNRVPLGGVVGRFAISIQHGQTRWPLALYSRIPEILAQCLGLQDRRGLTIKRPESDEEQ